MEGKLDGNALGEEYHEKINIHRQQNQNAKSSMSDPRYRGYKMSIQLQEDFQDARTHEEGVVLNASRRNPHRVIRVRASFR